MISPLLSSPGFQKATRAPAGSHNLIAVDGWQVAAAPRLDFRISKKLRGAFPSPELTILMFLHMYLYIHLVWFCNEPNTHQKESIFIPKNNAKEIENTWSGLIEVKFENTHRGILLQTTKSIWEWLSIPRVRKNMWPLRYASAWETSSDTSSQSNVCSSGYWKLLE